MKDVNLNNDTTECIVKTQHLTNETVHNICTNQTYTRNYGLGDYGLGLMFVGLGLCLVSVFVIIVKVMKDEI